ncbi:hypothetical protein HYG87_02715 [Methanobacterium alkalithermotolerans]|uniref:Uncharacterized protein n=1 Tax=Methanobacterium alkalithermotolerans TaxID=2731220 RepID=A0A8T8KBI9_9EURY|nr:hypothetical protein [Methanobacterium alkalithermotolerans]QUH22761.1 hypothetical protein HYG87_02715 [Methanobacterium alkalithermotolerans]
MGELDDKVVFTKSSGNSKKGENQLKVIQDIVKLKIRQTGTITVEFNGKKEEISKIKDFFENITDMEPITMNIADSGDIKSYFKGVSPFKEEISPEGETYYTFGVTIQEIA